jgi:hypothetical protein
MVALTSIEHASAVRKSEIRAAAVMLRAIVERIQTGELTAPNRVTARLEGAATALEALSGRAGPLTRGDVSRGRLGAPQRKV